MEMENYNETWMHDVNRSDYYLDPFEEIPLHHRPAVYAVGSLFIIVIIVSVITNIIGFASLVHFRMWLRHEGYFYLVAIFASNIGILIFESTSFCITHWNFRYYPPDSSEFMCKVWHFLMTIYFSVGWLSVALLMDVYLREHLVHRRRCGCPLFAAKYCTLFASKIIVGIIFGLVLILGLPQMGLMTLEESPIGLHCGPHRHFLAFHVLNWVKFGLMWALPFVFFMPVILLLTLCISREGGQTGFSQIGERSLSEEQLRTVAATLSAMTLFSHFTVKVILGMGLSSVKGISISSAVLQTALALSMGFQPILCFIILAELRAEILRKLGDLGCCPCLIANRSPSSDVQNVRMQDIEENPE